MDDHGILGNLALALQIAVAVYALWLRRVFRNKQAAWALCLAFVLMFLMHLNEAWEPPVTVSALGIQPGVAYMFISILLFLGLSHLGTVFREREAAEEQIRQARDLLEIRVGERTAELVQANNRLELEIHQRRQAEEEIRASHELYRGLVDSQDGIIFECRASDLAFTFVSPQCERLLGYTAEEWLRELTWRSLIQPDDYPRFEEARRRAMEADDRDWLEYRVATRDRRIRWVRHISSGVGLRQGEDRMRGVLLDITERKQMEHDFRQMQKMEAIGRLAGGVAHDFNNLLTVIQGYSQLVIASNGLGLESTDHVRQVLQAADRAAGLTQQLLAFSRKREICKEPVNINDVVRNISKMLRAMLGETIEMQVVLEDDVPLMEADAGQLGQVFMNLAVNARDAMPFGGSFSIRTRSITVPGESSASDPETSAGRFVCVSVTDSGTGIAPEILPHIFEPFFTTKDVGKGTGLGLSTVYGIVKQHHGWVKVDSELNQGTTFRLFLPAATELIVASASSTDPTAWVGAGETLLVVEDEPGVLELVASTLEANGYRVLQAKSAAAALSLWHSNQRAVDLLITDVVMPEMAGPDLVSRLRLDAPSLPAILMSGYAATELSLTELDAFIQKPYRPATLMKMIRQLLISSRASRPLSAEPPPGSQGAEDDLEVAVS